MTAAGSRIGHLEQLRGAEIAAVRHLFTPGMRVLEIGGGNGYQARHLAEWGCDVVAIDIPTRRMADDQHYPVMSYDGQRFPFRSAAFDVVFSSNVLEHVKLLDAVLAESGRVLKPHGMAIHILPTPTWRFWTSVAHYPYLLKYLAFRDMPMPGSAKAPGVTTIKKERGIYYVLRRALSAGPHGEYRNAAAEFYYFSARCWRRVFAQHGFDVIDVFGAGVFHTGYSLAPWLSASTRRALASMIGSACRVYQLRRM